MGTLIFAVTQSEATCPYDPKPLPTTVAGRRRLIFRILDFYGDGSIASCPMMVELIGDPPVMSSGPSNSPKRMPDCYGAAHKGGPWRNDLQQQLLKPPESAIGPPGAVVGDGGVRNS
jgi:hypothetical protein